MEDMIAVLALFMALCAIGIVSVGAIRRMILLYQLQSVILAILTVMVGYGLSKSADRAISDVWEWLLAFAILIPGFLAYTIEPLLVQATVPPEMHWTARIVSILRLSPKHRQENQQLRDEALIVWLEQGLSPTRQVAFGAFSLFLTAIASWAAMQLFPKEQGRMVTLAISLTLLMLGILAMISREDLISQIMGLLVMDHGLFLGTVAVLSHPNLIPFFVSSLFLYILITLIILIVILPELHNESGSIKVNDQSILKG